MGLIVALILALIFHFLLGVEFYNALIISMLAVILCELFHLEDKIEELTRWKNEDCD